MLGTSKTVSSTSESSDALWLVGLLVALSAGANLLLLGAFVAPIIASILGGLDFSRYFIPLAGGANPTTTGQAVLGWSVAVALAVVFAIIAFVLFRALRLIMRMRSFEIQSPEQRLANFHKALRADQKDLGSDFEKAIFDKVWDLYAR